MIYRQPDINKFLFENHNAKLLVEPIIRYMTMPAGYYITEEYALRLYNLFTGSAHSNRSVESTLKAI